MHHSNADTIALPGRSTAAKTPATAAAPKNFVGVPTNVKPTFHGVPSTVTATTPDEATAQPVPSDAYSSVTYSCQNVQVHENEHYDKAQERVVAVFGANDLKATWEKPEFEAKLADGSMSAALKRVTLTVANSDGSGLEVDVGGLGEPVLKASIPQTSFLLTGAMPTATAVLYESDLDTNVKTGKLFSTFGHMLSAKALAKTHGTARNGAVPVQYDSPISNVWLSSGIKHSEVDSIQYAQGRDIFIPESQFASVKEQVQEYFSKNFRLPTFGTFAVTFKSPAAPKKLGSTVPLSRSTFRTSVTADTNLDKHVSTFSCAIKVEFMAFSSTPAD